MSEAVDPETLFRSTPVNRFLGFALVSYDETGAELAMQPRQEHIQEKGVVQGGILTALADTAAVYALLPQLPPDLDMTGVELKMNFLRPALADRGELRARSRVVRRGRRIGVCQVEVSQRDRPVAIGTFTYLFFERG